MRRKFFPFVGVLLATFLMTSCLKDDEAEVVYYNDTAITSFALGTLNCNMHTTSSTGEDSAYVSTLDCSTYRFNIDQFRGEIYNVDSLPVNVDVSKSVCTISAKNGGYVVLNLKTSDGKSDSLVYFSSTDSLDLTKAMEIRAYNAGRTDYRTYMLKVNVHTEYADSFNWTRMTEIPANVASLLNQRAEIVAGKSWQSGPFADAEDQSLLPTENISYFVQPLLTDPNSQFHLLIGNRSMTEYPDDETAVVWGRYTVAGDNSNNGWFCYKDVPENYRLPRLQGLQVVSYDNGFLALGGKGIGGCQAEPFAHFYTSKDRGLTWQEDSIYTLPQGFNTSTTSFSMIADEENFLWLIDNDANQIWRGRINRLGWRKE